MSQFEAKVKATLDLSGISSQLQSIGKEPIVLKNVKIGNVDMSALQKQFNSIGRNAGKSLKNGMQQATKSGSSWRSNNVSKYLSDYNKALKSVNTGKLNSDLQSVKANYDKIANSGNTLNTTIQSNINQLQQMATAMRTTESNGIDGSRKLVNQYREYDALLTTTKNQISSVSAEMKQFASASQIASSQNKMNQFLNSGTKAAKEYGAEVRRLVNELNTLSESGKVNSSDLKRINERFNTISQESKAAGKNVVTFGSRMKSAFSKLSNYVGASTIIYGSIRTIKSGINEVVALDDALVDLKKTSSATGKQLNDFYFTANDSAKKFGTTTKDIIQGAADWSRLGYNLEDSKTMSEVSSVFKSISPGMTIEQANDGLISVMKAYKIEASDALDGVASKINKIGKVLPKHTVTYGNPKWILADNYIGQTLGAA